MALDGLIRNFRSILLPSPYPGVTASQGCTCLILTDIKVIRWEVLEGALPSVLLNLHRILTAWLGGSFRHDLFPPLASSPFPPIAHVKLKHSVRWFFLRIQHVTQSAWGAGKLQHPESPVIGLGLISCLTFSQATRKCRTFTTLLVWDHDLFLNSEDRQNL